MDQLFQLHRQIQDLKQEVSTINQVANQLQRAEANNAAQLQRLQQNEVISTQQLQNIQQLCNRMNQEVNIISNVAQQVTSQMVNRPFTSGQYGSSIGSQFATGQYGNIGNPNQISAYGSTQVNPTDISSLASYWGQGLNPQDMAVSSQFLSNQNKQFMPQSYGTSTFNAGTYGTGITQIPSSQYIPSFSTSLSTPNQFGTNMSMPNQFGTSLSTPNQIGTSLSTPNQFGTGIFGTQSSNMLGSQYMGSSY